MPRSARFQIPSPPLFRTRSSPVATLSRKLISPFQLTLAFSFAISLHHHLHHLHHLHRFVQRAGFHLQAGSRPAHSGFDSTSVGLPSTSRNQTQHPHTDPIPPTWCAAHLFCISSSQVCISASKPCTSRYCTADAAHDRRQSIEQQGQSLTNDTQRFQDPLCTHSTSPVPSMLPRTHI